MGRASGAVATAVVAAVLVVTLTAPGGPQDATGQAADDVAAAEGAERASAVDVAYERPVPGDLVAAFEDPAAPWLPGHRGVDLAGTAGESVRAAADGVVAFAGSVAGRPVVSIDHADGIRTTYEPVQPAVTAGQVVRGGDVVGALQAQPSHCTPAACLHWGARIGRDDYLDPMSLLSDAVIRLYPIQGSAGVSSSVERSAGLAQVVPAAAPPGSPPVTR